MGNNGVKTPPATIPATGGFFKPNALRLRRRRSCWFRDLQRFQQSSGYSRPWVFSYQAWIIIKTTVPTL